MDSVEKTPFSQITTSGLLIKIYAGCSTVLKYTLAAPMTDLASVPIASGAIVLDSHSQTTRYRIEFRNLGIAHH